MLVNLLLSLLVLSLLALEWFLLTLEPRRRLRGREIECRLRQLERRLREFGQEIEPPPGFKERLWQRLFPNEAELLREIDRRNPQSPPCCPPPDGQSPSGIKPQRSSSASPAETPAPWETTEGASDSSSSGQDGSDTRGRVLTFGATRAQMPVLPGPSTSMTPPEGETHGLSGVVNHDECHWQAERARKARLADGQQGGEA